ncbi:unnamed protein product [Sphenostylis stenocarpa]|uniref:Neprosin PEP catalytic domain-containing protein n=1 Tax=Sphenostylis stenocarpa TaxID=92480 RepID=A0AA86VZY6_9FABA|nr:unnamed protein product [Sphenostylis stenocarpa]
MMNILLFVLFLVNSHANRRVHGIQNNLKEDLELERQLKIINKPPIKTIHVFHNLLIFHHMLPSIYHTASLIIFFTEFGDIVDCIDIYKQPAFDHPLLKDHKLQMKPSFQNSIEKTNVNNSGTGSMFGLGKDKCPTGTVPILRITKDDLIRQKSLSDDDILVQGLPGIHKAAEVSLYVSHKVDAIQTTFKEDLELEEQLRIINKPSVKTIHAESGDIVDCIDIYKQPAFDHPLLKDHKLQMKPTFQNSMKKTNVNNSRIRSMFGLGKEKCPRGTVPILRTRKDDLMREKSSLNNHILLQGIPGVHLAEVSLRPRYGPYYGVSGINSVYNPRITDKRQISMSHIWVENGPKESTNKISAGWHRDNYVKTGCYNIRCSGFVQTGKKNYLGARLPNISIYGGPTYEFAVSISQDPVTKNWWLSVDNSNLGYFPAALFPNLGSADIVGWGGRTRTSYGNRSPQMGSGYFPARGLRACYFREISILDSSRKSHGPETDQTEPFTDIASCYGVIYYGYQGVDIGYVLLFGGPGGYCGN